MVYSTINHVQNQTFCCQSAGTAQMKRVPIPFMCHCTISAVGLNIVLSCD
jgi:hypothetical protein